MARFHILECEHKSAIEIHGKKGDMHSGASMRKASLKENAGERKSAAFLKMRGSFDEFFPSEGDCIGFPLVFNFFWLTKFYSYQHHTLIRSSWMKHMQNSYLQHYLLQLQRPVWIWLWKGKPFSQGHYQREQVVFLTSQKFQWFSLVCFFSEECGWERGANNSMPIKIFSLIIVSLIIVIFIIFIIKLYKDSARKSPYLRILQFDRRLNWRYHPSFICHWFFSQRN